MGRDLGVAGAWRRCGCGHAALASPAPGAILRRCGGDGERTGERRIARGFQEQAASFAFERVILQSLAVMPARAATRCAACSRCRPADRIGGSDFP
jgi:hypothetical protein